MPRPNQKIYQGVRSNRYSGSKLTNWAGFHPWHSAVEQIHRKYQDEILATDNHPLVIIEPTHELFVCPLASNEIMDTLSKVPKKFTEDLEAVFVLAGSTKQAKVLKTLYCYGTYWLNCIFLAPFPKAFVKGLYRRQPKPSDLREYVRAGAEIRQTSKGLLVEFNEISIRNFYLQDVLMHELGHHIDRKENKNRKKAEGFAEWFATEYGYRLPPNN